MPLRPPSPNLSDCQRQRLHNLTAPPYKMMMAENLINQLVEEIIEALDEQPHDLEKLEGLLQEAKDLIRTPIFSQADFDDQDALENARRDLEDAIARLRQDPREGAGEEASTESTHVSEAERLMNEAERAFYAGKYLEAIGKYEKVLALEPDWPRAKNHKAQVEEYLNSGHLPAHALPPEAAVLFGKAQSALNVQSYDRASDYWEKAKVILEEAGIHNFKDGQEFERQLNQELEARDAYQEGLKLLEQGEWDEALNKIQAAASLAPLPLYKEKAEELKETRRKIREIRQTLTARPLLTEMVPGAADDLNILVTIYEKNPEIQRLQELWQATYPVFANQLINEMTDYLERARPPYAQCISDVKDKLDRINQKIRIIQSVSAPNSDGTKWQQDLEEIKKAKESIETAHKEDLRRLSRVQQALNQGQLDESTQKDVRHLLRIYPYCREIIKLGEDFKFRYEYGPRLAESQKSASGEVSQSSPKALLNRLEELLLEDITNPDLLLRYEWVKIQVRMSDRQSLFQTDRINNAQMLQRQSRIWFFASIFTGTLLLGISIVLIWLTFDQKNIWSAAVSLVSLLPALASGLIYRQAINAHTRADDLYEKIRADNQHDMEMEKDLFSHLQQRLFDISRKTYHTTGDK